MIQKSKVFKNFHDLDYKICVDLSVDCGVHWDVSLYRKKKNEKKWEKIDCFNDPEYMALSSKEDKDKYYKSFLLAYVPAFWIREVQGMVMKLLINKAIF